MKKLLVIFLAISYQLLAISFCRAQYTDLLNFNGTNGSEPFGTLTPTTNGKILYGTAYTGGAHDSGCVFSINANGSNYKDLYDFVGPTGSEPNSPLTLISGVLYGTAMFGGAHDSGCVFSVDTDGNNYRDIFDFNGTNGKNPYNSLIYTSGKLYGAADGGAHHAGCIFSLRTNGSGYRDIYDFNDTIVEYPLGLTLAGYKLYGMTVYGGAHDYGLIFSVDTNGGGYTDLLDFDITNGLEPSGMLTYSSGLLYGASPYGGANGDGLIFSIDTNGSRYTDLFDFNNTNGAEPEFAGGALTLSGSKLYGTAYYGGANDSGCIFSLFTNGSGYKDLHDFSWMAGSHAEGSLTLLGSTFYGATAYGGPSHAGILFSFDTAVASVKVIHDTICPGGSALLYVNGLNGATYSWSPGGTTKDSLYVSPLTTSTYTATSIQGPTHYTNIIKVIVIPLPVPVINATSIVCKGKTDTLTASGGSKYLWSNGSTKTIYYTGAIEADSTIYLTAYNSLGCTVKDTFKITVKICGAGIDEIQSDNVLQVYPNPGNGRFSILIRNYELGMWNVEVYNVLGKKIYSTALPQTPKGALSEIDLSKQPNGLYFYRVVADDGSLIGEGKLVILK